MKPEYLEKKAMSLSNEQIYSCINDSLLQALRMISLNVKPGHERYVFDGIIDIIRHRFNDFTMNQLDSAIRAGAYGEYGDYAKLNPKTLMDWFSKKRLEISANNERFSKVERREKEDSIIPCRCGGDAVILGLFYHQRGFKDHSGKEMAFTDRVKLIESGKPCPFTGGNIKEIISKYQITFRLESKR